jgi:hypothetical protein
MKFFYVLTALAAQTSIYFGWGNDSWMGNAALVIGGLFAGVLMAELLNDGDME